MKGEVRLGYKQTEVGVIPEDWEVKTLDSVALVTSGKRLPLGSSLTSQETPHPYIRVTDMRPGTVSLVDLMFVPVDVFPAISRFRIFKDDIFISVAGTLGIVGRVPKELDGANLTENADRITNLTCSQDFLLHVLMSPLIQTTIDTLQTIGAQPKLALTRIRKFLIPLPPTLAEQQAIAEALSDVDALIDALERLIAKKRAIKQGAMQELLTGRRRLPGFDGKWEMRKLGELGATYGGLTGKTKSDFGHGSARYIPFLNIITNVVIDPHDLELVRVAPSEKQNQAQVGDLFFNGSSETPEEVGMCSVLLEDLADVYLNSFCFGFRIGDHAEAHGLYLAYFFRSNEGRVLLYSLAQGATRYNLSKTNFLRLEIPIPALREQTAIAAILSDMDAEIAALERRLDKTRLLKQGMMQELLTGRTRLV